MRTTSARSTWTRSRPPNRPRCPSNSIVPSRTAMSSPCTRRPSRITSVSALNITCKATHDTPASHIAARRCTIVLLCRARRAPAVVARASPIGRGFILISATGGSMSRVRVAGLTVALCLASAAPSRADITAFIGANTTPVNRQVRGLAFGAGLLFVGFEFEYSNTSESTESFTPAPALKTGMANLLLQAPIAIFGFQPYFTTGGGIYREELAPHVRTGVSPNVGGGVKISLAGPRPGGGGFLGVQLGRQAPDSPPRPPHPRRNLKI